MKKTGVFSSNPVTSILFGFLLLVAFVFFSYSKGMSEEFIVLKTAGMLLWYVALGLCQSLMKEVTSSNRQSHSLLYSAFYGLIFATGMYVMIWNPGQYERGDLLIFLVAFILMSYIQYGQVCREIIKQAEKAER